MKIYMIFDCPAYYPSGGHGDFVAAGVDKQAAEATMLAKDNEFLAKHGHTPYGRRQYDRVDTIFDTDTMEFEEVR